MLQLSLLIGICFISLFVFHGLGSLLVYGLYDVNIFDDLAVLDTMPDAQAMVVGKIVATSQQVGFFLFPAIVFVKLIDHRPMVSLRLDQGPSVGTVLFVCVLMYSSLAFSDFIYSLNQEITLPGFADDLEEEAKSLTDKLLAADSMWGLLANLLLIALLPAIGEELVFRGLIQRFISERANNIHIGIWVSAIAFSFMHMQFYGFLPRMLLGAMFGYLLYWTGNLWVPIVGHFVNNAIAVIVMYFVSQGYFPETTDDALQLNWFDIVISIFLTGGILFALRIRGRTEVDYVNESAEAIEEE